MNSRQSAGRSLVDLAQALEVARQGVPHVHLPGEVASVSHPHGVGAGPQLRAERDAVAVVLHRLIADGGVGVAEAPELVREELARLVLERVGVHRVDEQPARLCERLELRRAVRLVPGDVQRDAGGRSHELQDDLAVLELLEDVARLAGRGEAREPRAARPHAPGRHGHAEAHRAAGERLDVEAAAGELAPEVLVVLFDGVQALAVRRRRWRRRPVGIPWRPSCAPRGVKCRFAPDVMKAPSRMHEDVCPCGTSGSPRLIPR